MKSPWLFQVEISRETMVYICLQLMWRLKYLGFIYGEPKCHDIDPYYDFLWVVNHHPEMIED